MRCTAIKSEQCTCIVHFFIVLEFTCKTAHPNSHVSDHNSLELYNIDSADLCWELCVASSGMTCLSVEYIFLESHGDYKRCTLNDVDSSHGDYCNCTSDSKTDLYDNC